MPVLRQLQWHHERCGWSWQWGGGGRGPCPPHPVPRFLSMRTLGRGWRGCPPVPILPSRRSPRRLPGEGSGGGGGGSAGCPHCRRPPRADPVSHRGSVGMAVHRMGTDSMHPATSLVLPPITAYPQELPGGHPAPCLPGSALTLQPEGTKYRATQTLDLGMMSLPPWVRHMARPCPRSLQAAQPCRGTWSFISSNPSVAMLPEGFFRGGLERRRTRLTLSRITWVQMGGQTQTCTQVAPTLCVDTPVYTELLPAPLLTQRQWDSTLAHHPPCPQVTEEC